MLVEAHALCRPASNNGHSGPRALAGVPVLKTNNNFIAIHRTSSLLDRETIQAEGVFPGAALFHWLVLTCGVLRASPSGHAGILVEDAGEASKQLGGGNWMNRILRPVAPSLALVALLVAAAACTAPTRHVDDDDDDDTGSGGSGSTTGSGSNGSGSYTPPEFATIEITDTLVQPWMAGGELWDGTSSVGQTEIEGLLEALSSEFPYVAVFDYVAGLAVDAYDAPDPFAYAERWGDGNWIEPVALCTYENNDEDTFAPVWPGDPASANLRGWHGVAVSPDMRIRVTVGDEDLSEHDSIGQVELNYDDVITALKAKQVHPIRVDDQGQGQVLFIGISAIPE